MKIVHLSLSDGGGGAASAAFNIHNSVKLQGCKSSMLVETKSSTDEDVIQIPAPKGLSSTLARKARSFFIRQDLQKIRKDAPEIFSLDVSRFGPHLSRSLPPCDIIHLHWVAAFLDYPTFFRQLGDHAKLCWTLHDMNPFTGGCHYSFDCTNFLGSCGYCPQLVHPNKTDLSAQILKNKLAGLEHLNDDQLTLVSPSTWVRDQAKQSSIFSRFSHAVIPHGIDCDTLCPQDRASARELFGIPNNDCKVIAFVSHAIDNPRKGFHLLQKALASLNTSEIVLLCVGGGTVDVPGVKVISTGYIADKHKLAMAYSAADFTVVPSVQDIGPLTFMESMACGTPIVGFPVGAMPDLVEHEVTGFLATGISSEELAQALDAALLSTNRQQAMRDKCRSISTELFSVARSGAAYMQMYNDILR